MKRHLNALSLVLAWIVIFAFFAAFTPPAFRTVGNLETLARQTAIVGTAAIGMTLIVIAGGIDLSVGSMVALVAVAIAWLLKADQPPAVAMLGGVLVAVLGGLLNGTLITRLKLTPFIVTLGSLLILRGAAKGIADEQKIDVPLTWMAQILSALAPGNRWMVFPPGVWFMVVAAAGTAALLKYTAFGRHIFAIGSNEAAARLCGVRVERVKAAVYALGGLFAGFAGVMMFSRVTVGDPTVAQGLELDVIAAVVIGGGSLSGGEGSILGSLMGALIMATIRAGCSQMGLPNWVQEMVTGGIIVAAVALDRYRHARAASAA